MVIQFVLQFPLGMPSLALYFPFKKLTIENFLPIRISSDYPWCGYTLHSYFPYTHIEDVSIDLG